MAVVQEAVRTPPALTEAQSDRAPSRAARQRSLGCRDLQGSPRCLPGRRRARRRSPPKYQTGPRGHAAGGTREARPSCRESTQRTGCGNGRGLQARPYESGGVLSHHMKNKEWKLRSRSVATALTRSPSPQVSLIEERETWSVGRETWSPGIWHLGTPYGPLRGRPASAFVGWEPLMVPSEGDLRQPWSS